ncbi:MAG: YdcF family protein [Chloroflexi bacterium]|nr:YdcF family protein [Chloroflexota bacterium]
MLKTLLIRPSRAGSVNRFTTMTCNRRCCRIAPIVAIWTFFRKQSIASVCPIFETLIVVCQCRTIILTPQFNGKAYRVTRGIVRTLVPTALIALVLWSTGCSSIQTGAGFLGEISNARPADVIIVLGSGLENDGSAGVALQRRARRAAEAFRIGLAGRVMCTGGRTGMAERTEADACREILVTEGVPPDAILLEDNSSSTEENAVNARSLMDVLGLRSAILVTDGFHMPRATLIFSEMGVAHSRFPVSRRFLDVGAYDVAIRRELTALQWYFVRRVLGLSPSTRLFG